MMRTAKPLRSAVCAIALNEDRYLLEWVAYHLLIGFDHIFIYDNMSYNYVSSVISEHILNSKVTVMRWPKVYGHSSQLGAYHHFLHTYRDEYEWAAVIDLDEYINLRKDGSIGAFLDRFPTASGVCLNWRIFGSSGKTVYEKKPMIGRFKQASNSDFEPNVHVKSIVRLQNIHQILIHDAVYKENSEVRSASGRLLAASPHVAITEDSYDIAYINHYFTKSLAEWKLKVARGYELGAKRELEMFEEYDRNELLDDSLSGYDLKVRWAMRGMRRRPHVVTTLRRAMHNVAKSAAGLNPF